jgi:hypothetical protein
MSTIQEIRADFFSESSTKRTEIRSALQTAVSEPFSEPPS